MKISKSTISDAIRIELYDKNEVELMKSLLVHADHDIQRFPAGIRTYRMNAAFKMMQELQAEL